MAEGYEYHRERHADPSHHVGTCDADCRAARRGHPHKSSYFARLFGRTPEQKRERAERKRARAEERSLRLQEKALRTQSKEIGLRAKLRRLQERERRYLRRSRE